MLTRSSRLIGDAHRMRRIWDATVSITRRNATFSAQRRLFGELSLRRGGQIGRKRLAGADEMQVTHELPPLLRLVLPRRGENAHAVGTQTQ